MTLILIIVTVIISIISFNNRNLFNKLIFNPYQVWHSKRLDKLFSHAFIHSDFLHLFVNMFVLYSFGNSLEEYFNVFYGNKTVFVFLFFYLSAALVASLPALFKYKNNINYNSVGASGAVSAVLFANIIFSPKSTLMILPIPIPIPAYIFAIIYLAYSLYMSKKNIDNIGHEAHFTGAFYGLLFVLICLPDVFVSFIDRF